MWSQIRMAFFSGTPRAEAPCRNFCFWVAITSAFFFPIALRRMSASPMVKPARAEAICMTCSW